MLHTRCFQLTALAIAALAAPCGARAATLLEDDYSTFIAGSLEGQIGYTQTEVPTSLPIQVAGGRVVFPGDQSANNQDLYKNFSDPVVSPESETVKIFQSFKLIVDSVPAGTSSYFSALDATDAASFNNFRLIARAGFTPDTYQFGARVTGQAGYPFAYGEDLPLHTSVQLVLEADLVAGPQNDAAKLFLLPALTDPRTVDFSLLTPYAAAGYVSGADGDPASLGSFIFSQFGSATVQTSGIRFDKTLIFTGVPEPTGFAAFLGGAFLLRLTGRRKG